MWHLLAALKKEIELFFFFLPPVDKCLCRGAVKLSLDVILSSSFLLPDLYD